MTLVVSLGLTAVCVFQTSHSVIKPLRQLNSRMREILESDTLNQVSLGNERDTCKEINQLYESFHSLISDYKFIQNDFMSKNKSDVIAVIDLAEACMLFNGQNYKAAGVCYNNIGNVQYKNEKYLLAAENFSKAVHLALVCIGKQGPESFYQEFPNDRPVRDGKEGEIKDVEVTPPPGSKQAAHFTTVKAHRFYQFAMCFYKLWRYQNGGDLLDGAA